MNEDLIGYEWFSEDQSTHFRVIGVSPNPAYVEIWATYRTTAELTVRVASQVRRHRELRKEGPNA